MFLGFVSTSEGSWARVIREQEAQKLKKRNQDRLEKEKMVVDIEKQAEKIIAEMNEEDWEKYENEFSKAKYFKGDFESYLKLAVMQELEK